MITVYIVVGLLLSDDVLQEFCSDGLCSNNGQCNHDSFGSTSCTYV